MANRDFSAPNPAELRSAASYARIAADALARAIAAAATAGITIDDELYEATATLSSWSARLAGRAAQAGSRDHREETKP